MKILDTTDPHGSVSTTGPFFLRDQSGFQQCGTCRTLCAGGCAPGAVCRGHIAPVKSASLLPCTRRGATNPQPPIDGCNVRSFSLDAGAARPRHTSHHICQGQRPTVTACVSESEDGHFRSWPGSFGALKNENRILDNLEDRSCSGTILRRDIHAFSRSRC